MKSIIKINIVIVIIVIFTPILIFADDLKVLRFGYSSSQNPEVLIEQMTPLMKILSEQLGVNIEFVHKKTFSEMQKAYINQEIDFGIINAYSFLRILPYDSVEPIAARKIGDSKQYSSFFFTRKDSSIRKMEDLKGKIVALGDPYSTSSYLIPNYIFRQEGIHPETDFAETVIISKQDSLIFAVLNRTADAGVCASFIYNELPENVKSSLYVFKISSPFPLGPFIVNKSLDRKLITKIQSVLFTLQDSEAGKMALISAGIDGFEPVFLEDYQPLLELKDSMDLN